MPLKVKLCTRRRRHTWSACPYAHRGETARRRDPSTYHAVPCPEMRQVSTLFILPTRLLVFRVTHAPEVNVACTLTTISNTGSILQGWNTSPVRLIKESVCSRYCTVMCNKGAACNRALCFFAHSPEELRTTALSREVSFNNDPLTIADQLSDSCSSSRNNFEKVWLNQSLPFILSIMF